MKISAIRIVLLFILLISGCESATNEEVADSASPDIPDRNEIVMKKGMKITATIDGRTIIITAGKGLKRSYTWEGATRSVTMWPRCARWYGSMGIYYPGPGNHWKEHNGITRGVVQEGQQHFDSIGEAKSWLERHEPIVYRNDGLAVMFFKVPERHQLDAAVWQIYIGGKTISKYQEIDQLKEDERSRARFNVNYVDHADARRRKIYYVGGEKPKSLPGAQDDKIKVEFLP
jgi:hypothetical protein